MINYTGNWQITMSNEAGTHTQAPSMTFEVEMCEFNNTKHKLPGERGVSHDYNDALIIIITKEPPWALFFSSSP